MPRFPATLLSLLFLQLELWSVSAKPGRRPHYSVDADNNIVNNYNDRYTVNLTVAGTSVNCMLDTGSTDMYVAPPGGISGPFNDTGVFTAIFYGDGSNFVNGSVGLGQVEIAGFTIPNQAFINVTNSVGEEGDFAGGVFGLVGLGFDGPGGSIPSSLTAGGYNGTDVGKAVLSSIYAQNPDKGQFFSFSLSRVGDIEESADASLVISGYDDKYAAVQSAPLLPQFPANSGRWSVLTDGISVNGVDIKWNSLGSDVPAGKTAVLFDTGTTNFLVPQELRDAVYGAVPGAVLAKNSSIPNLKFSEDEDVWVIPCTTPVNMTVKFAGQDFPIHPLDLSDSSYLVAPDGKNYTVCVGSMTNGGSILGPDLDALYGDSFLRNVYSVFSFGNDTTPAHVQLLADTNTDDAAADFLVHRQEVLENGPPELSPKDIINLFDGSASGSSAAPSSTPTSAGSTPTASDAGSSTPTSADPLPECTIPAGSDALSKGKPALNLADGTSSSSDSTVSKYGPIIVGLLAANLVLLLVVAFFSVMNFVKNGRTAGPTRALNPSYVPVKLKEDGPRSSFSTAEHTAYSD
ncbi:Six-hairpin glycosidase [Mycena venus]|uniref:Six-hairpin glycosidase n=1 Tax=Mycena venus TaxID=2733690 RepID=A0A8H7D068_9AGAR|nr:Six-hairpin glycosidase [Mycena venus]